MRELVLGMIEVGCIQFSPKDPFTYASGLKGPIYCDNRLIPSHPKLRELVAKEFSSIIDSKKLSYDFVAGVATAGITHATMLAHFREEPMVYVRSKPKGHGQGRMVEGDISQGQSLLLVEDLINQGSSIGKVIEGVRDQGMVVNNALCIVDYQMENARKYIGSLKVDYFSLINFRDLVDTALTEKIIDEEDYNLLLEWQKDPESWS
ncbi:MAG: orotate phosphoribosyltransferase [Bacteriovorax sp. MedPE-SWde]|nr:MAG: orotate phosphoribosyltransferase [Bacteriovorax sp. MedPE-SWde]